MIRTEIRPKEPRHWGIHAALVVGFAICSALPRPLMGQGEWYLGMDLGPSLVPQVGLSVSDNDWSTKCDLLSNPNQIETGSARCNPRGRCGRTR